jgi:hypothetical protein
VKEEVLAAFDGLFDALLTRADPHEAMSRFADGDVIFWGSGWEEQALGPPPHSGPYRVTAVFVRRDGRWLWHTYSGSEPVD